MTQANLSNSISEKVTFIFDNISCSDLHETYKTAKLLTPNSSIRKACIEVINEALQKGISHYEDSIDESRAIAIYVGSTKIIDGRSGWDESGFGLRYAFNKDGTVRMLAGYRPLHNDWSLAEIRELIASGYIKGDTRIIIITTPTGLGAPGMELFDWTGFIADTTGLSIITIGMLAKFRQRIKSRRIRKIAQQWVKYGIRYPEQIREFIDLKAGWRLDEVKKRLGLDDEFAIKLLYSLGLEPKGNEWRLAHSKKSIESRKRWMRNEKKYKKEQEAVE